MNVVICVITIIGGFTIGVPPLNVIQMLWANLIMDILGAIAIGTEPYKNDDSGTSNRISRKDNIIKPEMMRTIICHAIYQIVVLLVLMFFGQMIFFSESFNLVSTPYRDAAGEPTNRLVLNTICFHTFILMNLFNTINCRVVDPLEFNVFKTLFNNPYLWLVLVFELFVQQMMIKAGNTTLGSALLGTAPLSTSMTVTCWMLGAFTLVVNFLSKQIPLSKFKFAEKIDLENNNKNSFIDNMFTKADDMYKKAGDQIRDDE